MRVSVVVPTCRRPDLLGRCLAALDAQHFDPRTFEILVADDAASADTRRQVEEFARRARPAVTYVPVTGTHGPAAARNAGWRRARGAVIAFTDDDCIPDPGWVAVGTSAFKGDDAVAAATGRTVVPLPARPTDYERDAAGLEGAEFVTANCFCRREALEAVGGFDERFRAAWREDSDLHFKLLRLGGKVVRVDAARVVHPVRPARWGVSLLQQRKALYDALLYKKHPAHFRRHIRPGTPWDYYAAVALFGMAVAAGGLGGPRLALAAAGGWAIFTGRFCLRRLRGTSRAPAHVAEMAVTSALIPFLSVYWRLYGAGKFGVLFL